MRFARLSLRVLAVLLPIPAIVIACGDSGDDPLLANSTPDSGEPTGSSAGGDGNIDALSAVDAKIDGGSADEPHCADYATLKRPFFGDLHSHTSYSADAYTFDTRNTPVDAYAFARGTALRIAGGASGLKGPITKIDRPLDFLAVTDHSEFLAAAYGCGEDLQGNPYDSTKAIYDTQACKTFRSTHQALEIAGIAAVLKKVCGGDAGTTTCDPIITNAWQREQQATAAAYEACKFTSFIAYEWTHTVDGKTLHKNVIFGDTNVPTRPYDSLTYSTQEQLWTALATGCADPVKGCNALTIPHNSNLSGGIAFEVPSASGDRANMVRFQKLVEIFQHKGGSECLSAADPDCTFEQLPDHADQVVDKPGYVRDGLKKGLSLQATVSNQNPLMLGFVGATDDHNGTPGNVSEATWPGHVGSNDDFAQKRIGGGGDAAGDGGKKDDVKTFNPGGITGVWAEQNTRTSIFAAFERRETFATSGPRITVRFYETDAAHAATACADANFPQGLVNANAVPMGGAFKAVAGGKPNFVVRAWKDATNLARVDLVKAWIDGSGAAKEKVISKPLTPAEGAAACVTYQDDDALAGPALYYARIMEAPTPRWSSYDCDSAPNANPTECAPNGSLRKMIQERAWTSAIWQTP